MADTAIIDVDGTLVDTNYQHAVAWFRAFARVGLVVPVWQIHSRLGMGGDKLVESVAGPRVERLHGDDVRDLWAKEFEDSFLYEVQAVEGAGELLDEIRRRGFKLVLASSGKPEHVEHFLDVLDAHDRADAWTSSDDVAATKPAPDLLSVALEKVGGDNGAVVGDSPYDFEAARRLGMPAVGLRTGGFCVAELTTAGAEQVFDSPNELREHLDRTALAHPR
jgi:HAD superfamily hydrolase (TIGR01549 family)